MKEQMKAWRLEKMGGKLELKEIPVPEVRAGSALIKVSGVLPFLPACSLLLCFVPWWNRGRSLQPGSCDGNYTVWRKHYPSHY